MLDHKGNGKIERLIRTINERLRTNKQIIHTKDKSGLSEILYSLRVNKKKDGSSPFEKHMGRKPNTVKSNLVRGFMDISEQDPNLDFSPSDFQDDLDSSILVRERARGSKLQGTFKKKSGKVVSESAHTLTMIPEKTNTPKVYSKRDVAAATEEQKKKLDNKKNKSKAKMAETTSSSDSEPQPAVRRKAPKKRKDSAPEIAFDFETDDRPSIIEIISNTTDDKEEASRGLVTKGENDETRGKTQIPPNVNIPIKASTSREVKDKEPKRVLERKRVPTQRYGIDVMKINNIREEAEPM